MLFLTQLCRLAAALGAAWLLGWLAARWKLPAILGWLVAGIALGPHALNVLSDSVMDAGWYRVLESVLECTVGLMIGTELVWSKLKRAGRQIVITTITESLGTFVVVSLVFGLLFAWTGTPVYLALFFGGIALATAPAPSLSIVNETGASGPVTRTLIPMAALDDLVGALVFFTVVAVVSSQLSAQALSVPVVLVLVFFPVFLGAVLGILAGLWLRRTRTFRGTLAALVISLLLTAGAGFFCNQVVLPAPTLNFLLLGMAFSTAVANLLPAQRVEALMGAMQPVIGVGLMVLILNLGAPLDYHLIFGAGVYTAVYIVARAVGKYSGAYLGAAATGAPATVRRYLGLTLLPHSGVSLVFTGVAVSILAGPAPECAALLQGTIAAAAVINEIIAVFLAKKGFEWAGELPDPKETMPHDTKRAAGA